MLLLKHVLIRFLGLLQSKNLLVQNRMNIARLNRTVHLLKLQTRANKQATYGAEIRQGFEESRLLRAFPTNKTDDTDQTVDPNSLQGLGHSLRPADFDDVINSAAACELFRGLAPVGRLLVVDNMVGAELPQPLRLFRGGCRRDNVRTSCLGELHRVLAAVTEVGRRGFKYLQREDGHPSRSLRDDPIALPQKASLQPVKRVPRRQPRTAERSRLQPVQVLGYVDQAFLIVGAVLAQRPIKDSTHAGGHRGLVQRSCDVCLVEECRDPVAQLKARDASADSYYFADAVGGGDDVVFIREGEGSLSDGEVAVVERGGVDYCCIVGAGSRGGRR